MLRSGFLLVVSIMLISFLPHKERNREEHYYVGKEFACTYETWQGRMDGKYVSYYKNGKKKAEGIFSDNYRTGIWSIWDTMGSLQMSREYTFFSVRPIYPKPNADSVLGFDYQRNTGGLMIYPTLKEKQILWAKRIWRYCDQEDNQLLFEKNRLFNIIQTQIDSRNLKPYSADNDQFQIELKMYFLDTNIFKVIGFKFKEDCFYEKKRKVSETRTIGICPVAFNKLKKDTVDLYWVYFPELRPYLAKVQVSEPYNEKIKTLDDVFFFRCFSGQIYKESNVYDRLISSYAKTKVEQKKESERIELEIIEGEHGLWQYSE